MSNLFDIDPREWTQKKLEREIIRHTELYLLAWNLDDMPEMILRITKAFALSDEVDRRKLNGLWKKE